MKVLVVDDSKAMRMIVKRQLTQIEDIGPLEVAEAGSGVEALEWVATNGAPDLILSDWNMPEMDGIDLLRALRGDGHTMTFGFVTSESQPAMKEEAAESGAQFFITKPFASDTFRQVLETVS
jgi:two-component system chemotaxis response regulator CheY